jgi:hypothetical protein
VDEGVRGWTGLADTRCAVQDFQAARSAADVRAAFKAGKFATLIGVEG